MTLETRIVSALNALCGQDGLAYRIKQGRYTNQPVDILLDSPKLGYWAVECKSLKNNQHQLYFSRNFSESKGKHQVDIIDEFIGKTGRNGYLIIEIRTDRPGRGRKNELYILPWKYVLASYQKKEAGISFESLRLFCQTFDDFLTLRNDEKERVHNLIQRIR